MNREYAMYQGKYVNDMGREELYQALRDMQKENKNLRDDLTNEKIHCMELVDKLFVEESKRRSGILGFIFGDAK